MDKKIKLAIKDKNTTNGLDLSTKPLFTVAIMDYERLFRFKPPNLNPYDDTKDLVNHVQSFKSHMIFLGASDEMKYKFFPLTFHNVACNWYSTLKPNSISYFEEFM